MISISLCMIVKNEQDTLSRCLDTISDLVDEIIIVDTGSADLTKKIAYQYTDKVYDFPWIEDFSAARNFSFSKASSQYILWLDADDVLMEPDRKKLKSLKQDLPADTDMVICKYHTGFDKQGNPVFSYYRERIIRNNEKYRWKGAVHEAISLSGNLMYTDIGITHKKVHPPDMERNLRIFQSIIAQGKKMNPREQFYYGRELYNNRKYEEAVPVINEFLENEDGWKENKIEACRLLASCYQLKGEDEHVLPSLYRSLYYGRPRAEVCCDIGNVLISREEYGQAIDWFMIASQIKRDDTSGGFIETECYGFIPNIQLCFCYGKLGEYEKAYECNELAGKYKPDAMEYLYNKALFNHGYAGKKAIL